MTTDADIFGRVFTGMFKVTIVGLGMLEIEAKDEQVALLVGQAAAALDPAHPGHVGQAADRFEVVEANDDPPSITVRPKSPQT